MNCKLLTILLCTSILLSQTNANGVATADVCANCDNNWAANRDNADAVQSNAFAVATSIKFDANYLALQIMIDAHLAADAAKDTPNPTWVIADWVAAYAYADADWVASNALAAMDWTVAKTLAAAIWTGVYAEADSQKVTAHAADAANVGNALERVPATFKAYHDCVGDVISVTAAADAIWLPAHVLANSIRHDAIISDRAIWNAAHHAADDDMVAARASGYTGSWCIADWVAANALADANFVAATVVTTNTWTDACALADADQTNAYNSYYSNSSAVADDEVAFNGGAATA